MSQPRFDAIAMVRKIRDAHYELLKDFSAQEKIQFFREKSRALHEELGHSRDPLASPRFGTAADSSKLPLDSSDSAVDAAWDVLADQRDLELESGAVAALSGEEVVARLRASLR